MASGRTWTILLVLLAAPLLGHPPAVAQGAFDEGHYDVSETLVVGPDDTLVLGPGVSLTGTGRLEVWGRLDVRGDADRPTLIALPIRLIGDEAHAIRHARLWGVDGTAVLAENGTLRLDDVTFEANRVGLDLAGAVLAQGANVTFRAQSDAGLLVGPSGRADLDAVRLLDNGEGARVLAGGSLRITGLHAEGNRVHLAADVAPAPDGSDDPRILLLDADLGATAEGGTAGVRLLAVPGNGSAPAAAMLFGGRIHDARVGIQATGPGLRLRVEGVAVEGNAVGLALSDATVDLKDVRLANARDIDGGETSWVSLENVTRSAAAADAPGPAVVAQAWPWWVPWLAMGGVLVVAAAILWTARSWRAAPGAPPAAMPIPTSSPIEEDAPDASPPPVTEAGPVAELGTQERRILADIVQNPDTAQAAVAERLGLSRQAVHYHVKKLEAKGLIRKTTKGRETQCRASDGAAAALAETTPGASLPGGAG